MNINMQRNYFEIQWLILKKSNISFEIKRLHKMFLLFSSGVLQFQTSYVYIPGKNDEMQQFTFEIYKINSKFQSLMF